MLVVLSTGELRESRAAALTRTDPARTLVIHQTVRGPRDGVSSHISARLNAVNTPGARTRTAGNLDSIDVVPSTATLHPRDYGSAMTQRALLESARQHIALQRPALVITLTALMRDRGVQSAVFSYDQEVIVAGTSQPKRLVWRMLIDQSSRALFGDPQLHDQRPLLVHVTYTPRAVTTGLPQSWAYPDAGQLTWQLVDSRMQPQSARTVIDTRGAYDALPSTPGTAIDPQAMLRCLVDARSNVACPGDVIDVRRLIDDTAATGAIVDYVSKVAPLYDSIETPAGSGRFEQVARQTLRIDDRSVNRSECGGDATYRNVGIYGFMLRSRVERYVVDRTGRFNLINSVASSRVSPITSFDVSRRVSAGQIATLGQWIIDPTNAGGSMLAAASLPNLSALAPIRNSAYTDPVLLKKASSDWRNGRHSAVSVECDRDTGTLRFIAGFALGGAQQFIAPRYAQFSPGQPASDAFETREDGQHDPCTSTAYYDGNRSIRFVPDAACTYGTAMYRHLASLAPNVTAVCAPGSFTLADQGPSVCYACPAGASLTFERAANYVPSASTRAVCESSNGWSRSQSLPYVSGLATFTVTW